MPTDRRSIRKLFLKFGDSDLDCTPQQSREMIG